MKDKGDYMENNEDATDEEKERVYKASCDLFKVIMEKDLDPFEALSAIHFLFTIHLQKMKEALASMGAKQEIENLETGVLKNMNLTFQQTKLNLITIRAQ